MISNLTILQTPKLFFLRLMGFSSNNLTYNLADN